GHWRNEKVSRSFEVSKVDFARLDFDHRQSRRIYRAIYVRVNQVSEFLFVSEHEDCSAVSSDSAQGLLQWREIISDDDRIPISHWLGRCGFPAEMTHR
ncbi:hypothetical protein PENTCL1PPCAC_10452, partial [Pristionchus entomophagus]